MSHQQLTLSFDSWSGGILLHPFDALRVGVCVFVSVCVDAMLLTTTSWTIFSQVPGEIPGFKKAVAIWHR